MAGAFFESFVISEIIKSYYNKGIINKITGVKRGAGGIICMYDKLTALKDNDRVIPINYL